MQNVSKISALACGLVLVGILLGWASGAVFLECVWRDDAIRAGFAEYNLTTGAWQWRKYLREPLHDARDWIQCPVCNGKGEMYLGDIPFDSVEAKPEPETWYEPPSSARLF